MYAIKNLTNDELSYARYASRESARRALAEEASRGRWCTIVHLPDPPTRIHRVTPACVRYTPVWED